MALALALNLNCVAQDLSLALLKTGLPKGSQALFLNQASGETEFFNEGDIVFNSALLLAVERNQVLLLDAQGKMHELGKTRTVWPTRRSRNAGVGQSLLEGAFSKAKFSLKPLMQQSHKIQEASQLFAISRQILNAGVWLNDLTRINLAKRLYRLAKLKASRQTNVPLRMRKNILAYNQAALDFADYEGVIKFYGQIFGQALGPKAKRTSSEHVLAAKYVAPVIAAYGAIGRLDKARTLAKKHIAQASPKDQLTLFLTLAQTVLARGEVKEALNYFNLAVQVPLENSQSAYAYYWLALSELARGESEKAHSLSRKLSAKASSETRDLRVRAKLLEALIESNLVNMTEIAGNVPYGRALVDDLKLLSQAKLL
jgi:tetratricopeptide (TPR) repeat protein